MELTEKQREQLWGDDGPYSQVNLIVQDRILDDSVSRTFLVVEAEINPLTFEIVRDHREEFKDNVMIQQLLDMADYRGKFGYVIASYDAEFMNQEDMEKAQRAAEYTRGVVILMHRFTMRVLGNLDDL